MIASEEVKTQQPAGGETTKEGKPLKEDDFTVEAVHEEEKNIWTIRCYNRLKLNLLSLHLFILVLVYVLTSQGECNMTSLRVLNLICANK